MAGMITRVKLYKDDAGEWRFTSYAANNEAIVVSSESYHNKQDALSAIYGVHGEDISIEDTGDVHFE